MCWLLLTVYGANVAFLLWIALGAGMDVLSGWLAGLFIHPLVDTWPRDVVKLFAWLALFAHTIWIVFRLDVCVR